MVIRDINKLSFDEIKSLQNEDNTIRWIIEENPDWDKFNLLRECHIDTATRIVLVISGKDNNVNYLQYESIKNNVVGVELYNYGDDLKTIAGVSTFSNLEYIVITDLYDKNIDLSELKYIHSLKELTLLYKNLTKEQHYAISDLKNLETLTVKGLDTELLEPLEKIKKLECFSLKNSKGLDLKFPMVEELAIRKSSKDVVLDFIPKLKHLSFLGLTSVNHVEEIPDLNHLENFDRLAITNAKNLRKFPALNGKMRLLGLTGNLPNLDVNELSELTPENLPKLERIIVNLGRVAKTNLILDRFKDFCSTGSSY